MHQHRHSHHPRIPKEFQVEWLMSGTKAQCLAMESELRPKLNIGWNFGIGGHRDGRGNKGVPKSAEQRAKMSATAKARYVNPAERIKTQRAVKKAFKNINRSGANNGHFGKPCSEETKQKMRDAIKRRGGVNGENNPNYRHGRYT
jgi:hypothetical protein